MFYFLLFTLTSKYRSEEKTSEYDKQDYDF